MLDSKLREVRWNHPMCPFGGMVRPVARDRRRWVATFAWLAVALAMALASGCRSTDEPTEIKNISANPRPTVLSAGDVVRVSFTGAPELSQTQKIPPDGKLSLPLIGEVMASGKSLDRFRTELGELYKPHLQNNEVLVSLESSALPVVVSGEVQHPGKIAFERPATVLEAIMEAGGFTPYGDPRKVYLIRIVNGQHQRQVLDIGKVFRGAPEPAIYVHGGDVIYVSAKPF